MYIKGDTISDEGKTFVLADLITSDFYRRVRGEVDKYLFHSYFDNKLYDLIVEPYLALRLYIEDNDVKKIALSNNAALQLITADIAKEKGIIFMRGTAFCRYKIYFTYLAYVLASSFYLMWLMIRIPHDKISSIDRTGIFSVVRTKSGKGRMQKLGIPFEWESPYEKTSIYRLYDRWTRLGWVLRAIVKGHKGMLHDRRAVSKLVGYNSGWVVYHSFQKRVVHTYLYWCLIREYVSSQSGKLFYTTNNRDRFSMIEEEAAHDFGKTLVCIPHGLAYGYKFPRGFACDVFYTMSQYAADYLNDLYKTKKFVYSEDIAKKMLLVTREKSFDEKRLVFFSEPREQNVNKEILDFLLPELEKKGIKLWMKIHPKENKADYKGYRVDFLDSLDDALQSNVCFARKSTTLIESAYNDSDAAAIVINPKDESIFSTFPSLQSEKIKVFKDLPGLLGWIEEKMK